MRGYPKGTAFEDLPEDYTCPVCGMDPQITSFHGPVGKSQFDPILDV
jgi:rubredoxin